MLFFLCNSILCLSGDCCVVLVFVLKIVCSRSSSSSSQFSCTSPNQQSYLLFHGIFCCPFMFIFFLHVVLPFLLVCFAFLRALFHAICGFWRAIMLLVYFFFLLVFVLFSLHFQSCCAHCLSSNLSTYDQLLSRHQSHCTWFLHTSCLDIRYLKARKISVAWFDSLFFLFSFLFLLLYQFIFCCFV